MKTLTVALPEWEYNIRIGRGLLARAGEELRAILPGASRPFVVTDSHVVPLYLERVWASLEEAGFWVTAYTVPAGESSKCAARLAELWEAMMDAGLIHIDAVVALSGGVVGDLAGFAAATALRGVDLMQIPTILLAQADSFVGGKVAADLEYGRNLTGASWQPRLALMDPEVPDTLPLPVSVEGMAEVIKYGCIKDAAFFDFLAVRPSRVELMVEVEHILYTCCAIERSVVEQDGRDMGEWMLLNFGHTLSRAYESAGHYTERNHDAAVATGICVAVRLGVRLGVTPAGLSERLEEALSALGLSTVVPCTAEDYAAAMGLDKKGAGEDIPVILPECMGRAVPHRMPKSRLPEELQ